MRRQEVLKTERPYQEIEYGHLNGHVTPVHWIGEHETAKGHLSLSQNMELQGSNPLGNFFISKEAFMQIVNPGGGGGGGPY